MKWIAAIGVVALAALAFVAVIGWHHVLRRRAAPPTAALPVVAARAAVAGELQQLAAGDRDGFAASFLPSVSLAPGDFDACREHVRRVAVRPDWEKAVVADGVVSVSMFGKSMTGFHLAGGRWLADRVWCRPVF